MSTINTLDFESKLTNELDKAVVQTLAKYACCADALANVMVCRYDASNGTRPIWILLFGVKFGIIEILNQIRSYIGRMGC